MPTARALFLLAFVSATPTFALRAETTLKEEPFDLSPSPLLPSLEAEPMDLAAALKLDAPTQPDPRVEGQAFPQPRYPWKTGIVGTVFWIGEQPGQNNPVPNTKSSWDVNWMSRFGGVDDPNPMKRTDAFHPAGFVPMQNPFYVALPYNDIRSSTDTKDEASKIIPWFKDSFQKEGRSVCHNRWIAIHHQGRVCFAQWSDCGPFTTSDSAYVFGDSRPTNTKNGGAGIDLSPAVRDFLSFHSGDRCDWRFVDEHEVAEGPWKQYGTNNPFASAHKTETRIPAAPEDDGKITATFSVSTYRPVAGVKSKKKAATEEAPVKSKTSKVNKGASKAGGSRLDELKRMRDEWFNAK